MTRKIRRILPVAACCALLASVTMVGCQRAPGSIPPDVAEPVELQTYDVPPEYQDQLRTMLRSALDSEGNRIGRVTSGPGGTLLVVAPPRIQAGVREILKKGFQAPPVPGPVKLTYWLLVGRPMAPASGKPSLSIVGGRQVQPLTPVLSEIVAAQGPTEFSLLERIDLTSMSQERAQTRGSFARIAQRATRTGEQIVSDIEIQLVGNDFQSQVMLKKNQFLVLGQSGFGGKRAEAFPGAANGDVLTLYYVMAADLES